MNPRDEASTQHHRGHGPTERETRRTTREREHEKVERVKEVEAILPCIPTVPHTPAACRTRPDFRKKITATSSTRFTSAARVQSNSAFQASAKGTTPSEVERASSWPTISNDTRKRRLREKQRFGGRLVASNGLPDARCKQAGNLRERLRCGHQHHHHYSILVPDVHQRHAAVGVS